MLLEVVIRVLAISIVEIIIWKKFLGIITIVRILLMM